MFHAFLLSTSYYASLQSEGTKIMSDRDRFDKFTERARRVLSLAQEEAQRFQHNYIGTEHLLLGLVREGEGVAARVLTNLGAEQERVRRAVEFIIGRGDRIVLGEIGLTPRAKKIIELAVDEARRLNHHYIGTEHILLGLVREGEGIASGVLVGMGINLERVRAETLRVLGQTTVQIEAALASTPTKPSHLHSFNGFERYTFADDAKRAISLAWHESKLLQHSYIGPEHLLLGLIRYTEGGAAQVLLALGVDQSRASSAVEKLVGKGEDTEPRKFEFTPLTQAYIHLAADEALKLKSASIGSEHLLLGLVREEQGIIPSLLSELGTDVATVRTKTLQTLSGQ